jgi:hypothetical protein
MPSLKIEDPAAPGARFARTSLTIHGADGVSSVYLPLGDDGSAGLPDVLPGREGLPDGFIALGLFMVLPVALPVVDPVVVLGPVPVIAPEPVVPDGVPTVDAPGAPVPLAPAALPACANAIVLERASAPASANVITFIGIPPLLSNQINRKQSRLVPRSWGHFTNLRAAP